MRVSPLVRPLTAVAAAALVAGALAGCTAAPFGGCEPAFEPGDASKAVSVRGDVGETPIVDYPTPLIAPTPERSLLVRGDGDPIAPGQAVLVDVTMYDGGSDAVVAQGSALIVANDTYGGFGESLLCATEGSRLALVGAPADLGLQSSAATVVVVVDVAQAFLGRADGVNQLPLDGMPTVVTAVDGTPGIALAYSEPPAETRVATIKAGGGATVADGDTVAYHARSWNWPTAGGSPSIGQLDTWSTFRPGQMEVDAESDEALQGAVLGAKVGTQLLVVIPGTDGGTTSIVVFDILGIVDEE